MDSFETVSKLQTGLTVLLTVLGFVTLTFKLRGDHLRKLVDSRRVEDHEPSSRELEQKALEDQPVTAETVQALQALQALQSEPQRVGDGPSTDTRHFPKEKTAQFLQVLSNGISGPTPLTLGYVEAADGEPRDFASEFATIFGGDPASMTIVAPSDPPITGIMIQDSADAHTPSKFAANLMAAFESVGFKCSYGKGSPKPGVVRIVVGPKE